MMLQPFWLWAARATSARVGAGRCRRPVIIRSTRLCSRAYSHSPTSSQSCTSRRRAWSASPSLSRRDIRGRVDMRAQVSFAVSIRSRHIGLAAIALLTGLSCLPFLRSIFSLSDEGVLLQGADRLLRGERLYRDFFEFLPPGGFFLTAGWFGLTNVSLFSARVLATFTFIGIACVLYCVALRVSCNTLASTLCVVVFVVTSQGVWMEVNHHWFTTLF